MAQQVRAQRLGQRLARRREHGGPLGERVRASLDVPRLRDPVGVEQQAVPGAGVQPPGPRRIADHVEKPKGRRRRERVEQHGPPVPQQQGRRVATADDRGFGAVVERHRDQLRGHEFLVGGPAGDESMQSHRHHLQRIRAGGQIAEGALHLGRGLRRPRPVTHHVADEQPDRISRLDSARDITAGVARDCRSRAGDPREGTTHVSTRGQRGSWKRLADTLRQLCRRLCLNERTLQQIFPNGRW